MATVTEPRPRGLLLRIAPPGMYAGRASMIIERQGVMAMRHWPIVLTGLLEPVLYLLAFKVGFGVLVGHVVGPAGEHVSYTEFVAPALLAAAAMNGAVFETTYPIYFKLRFSRVYDAMLATPVGPYDIAIGEISWAMLRGGFYSTAFVVVMAVMGLLSSPWAVLMVPAALLVAFTFAAVGMALATFIRSTSQFDYINVAVVPLFLFSTTFFPLAVYPDWLQPLVRLSPLYHGIDLMRGLSAGMVDAGMLGHVAFLLALAAVGVWGTGRRIGSMLRT